MADSTEQNTTREHGNMEAVLARLEKIEKQNRRFRFVGLVFLVGLLALGTISWKQKVEYERYEGQFLLQDKLGITRGGLLTVGKDKYGQLWLGTAGKNTRGEYQAKIDVMIGYDDYGTPSFQFLDNNGKQRVVIGESRGGAFNIWLYNEKGETIWTALK